MEVKFSKRLKEVVALSRQESIRLGHGYIGVEHLLLGLIAEGEGVAVSLLRKLGVPMDEAIERLESYTRNTSR